MRLQIAVINLHPENDWLGDTGTISQLRSIHSIQFHSRAGLFLIHLVYYRRRLGQQI